MHLNLTESIIQQQSRFDTQKVREEDLDKDETEDSMQAETGEQSGSVNITKSSMTGQRGSRQQDNTVGFSSSIDPDGSRQQGSLNNGHRTFAGSR